MKSILLFTVLFASQMAFAFDVSYTCKTTAVGNYRIFSESYSVELEQYDAKAPMALALTDAKTDIIYKASLNDKFKSKSGRVQFTGLDGFQEDATSEAILTKGMLTGQPKGQLEIRARSNAGEFFYQEFYNCTLD